MSTFFMMALGPAGGSVTPPVAASMASVLVTAIVYGERERKGGVKDGMDRGRKNRGLL